MLWTIGAASAFAVLGSWFWRFQSEQDFELLLPRQNVRAEFVTSNTCRECHPEEHASWHRSYHRTMTQIASPQTVAAPMDDLTLTFRNRSYHVERKGGEFWVTMADPVWELEQVQQGVDLNRVDDPPTVTRRIVLCTGSHHMQTYWISSGQGRELSHFPWMYHLTEKEWIPATDTFLNPPDSPRGFHTWNAVCIHCHSVFGRPGYDADTEVMNSDVVEFGISCEACHGPGAEHAAYQRQGKQTGDDPIVNPSVPSPRLSSQICGRCHSDWAPRDTSRFAQEGLAYRPGDPLEQFVRFTQPDDPGYDNIPRRWNPGYWGDGSCRVGGDEYLGLMNTACFLRGSMACGSCHSMHQYQDPNDQLMDGLDDNQACVQCHRRYADDERLAGHTHHAAGSRGSRCYDCHMPHTAYALFTALRSHRIDSPSVLVSVETGRPNACNLCHLDQTLKWTADNLTAWYDQPPVRLSEDEERIAASLLWLLRGHALQRALVAWHMNWKPAQSASGHEWLAPFLAQLLADPYSAVRFIARRSLRGAPGFEGFDYEFLGPQEVRRQAREQVLRQWRTRPLSSDRRLGRLLINPDGSLRLEALQRLLSQRDDQPINIPE